MVTFQKGKKKIEREERNTTMKKIYMSFNYLNHGIKGHNEEEKLKFYITSCSFCLYNSSCSLQSGSHRSSSFRKWEFTILGTGAYLTHPCLALCNCPAPENMLNACPYKGQASPSLSWLLFLCTRSPSVWTGLLAASIAHYSLLIKIL